MQATGSLPSDTFWYLDPPFFARADRLYRYYFLKPEHARLRDALLSLKDSWMLSYDSLTEVQRLYHAARQPTHVEALYSTSSNGHVPKKEAIVTNLRSVPDETRLWKKSIEWKRNGTLNGDEPASSTNVVKASRR
jgi:DNA adenine methylase